MSDELRRRILDAARSDLVENGYRGLRLAAVARAARVPLALLHCEFPQRSSLVKALVEHDLEIFLSRLTSAVPTDAGLDAMLSAGLGVFFDFVAERREEYRILFGDAGRFDPAVAALLRELRERLATIYLALFRPAVEAQGVVWPSDAEARLRTHAVISLAEGGALAWVADDRLARDVVLEVLTRMIRQSLLSPARGTPAWGRQAIPSRPGAEGTP